jgi:hypothetical protein
MTAGVVVILLRFERRGLRQQLIDEGRASFLS